MVKFGWLSFGFGFFTLSFLRLPIEFISITIAQKIIENIRNNLLIYNICGKYQRTSIMQLYSISIAHDKSYLLDSLYTRLKASLATLKNYVTYKIPCSEWNKV